MRASEDSYGVVVSRSSWLMNPFVSPVALATCSIVRPRSRRKMRSREPTLTSALRGESAIPPGMRTSYGVSS